MIQQNTVRQKVYYQLETANKSFRDMYAFLKAKKVKNNKFFLILYDPDLAGVDPYDPNLNAYMKRKVIIECIRNYWYFLREVVRIPDQGATGKGKRYELHRGNLAMSFCVSLNLSIFFELSRQLGKTTSVLVRLLWEFNFGTSHSVIAILNKKHEDSKGNLRTLKEYRDALPSYLKMDQGYDSRTGKKLRPKSNVETLEHISNGNVIRTIPSASSKNDAMGRGRGLTVPRIYYDEYAFAKFNREIYMAAAPAYKTASANARRNGAPYGIILTTTPGDLTTDEGMEAFNKKDLATPFSENWYDMPYNEIMELVSKNEKSIFVYIRFTYKQVGKDEQWLKEAIVTHEQDWNVITREYLLNWSHANLNSPFTQADLNIVKTKIRQPIKSIQLRTYYTLDVFELPSSRDVCIIGVDVSGGFKRDASAITVINSRNTHVCMTLNCNYISIIDLACVIIELVDKYLPNAVVNVERNGGFGASVLAKLVKSKIKKNLYYEIKDKVIEEQAQGTKMVRKTRKTKVFGLDNTHNVRDLLMEILRERMELHKDKFIAPKIFEELETLEVKKNGKIEHTSTGHDDQIFSYLMALYVWYEGIGLKERWGINKSSLRTDQDIDEAVDKLDEYNEDTIDLSNSVEILTEDDDSPAQVKAQLEYLKSDKTMLYNEWKEKERQKDQEALQELLRHPVGKKAWEEKFHCKVEDDNGITKIPDNVFNNFYK